jgi:hypothetical protein
MTKNLTLAVDEELLERFRLHAAERKTSVNALIRQYMEERTGLSQKRREARAQMAEMARANAAEDQPGEHGGWRWNREDCYSGPRFDRMRNH